jgi:hypothetical protein
MNACRKTKVFVPAIFSCLLSLTSLAAEPLHERFEDGRLTSGWTASTISEPGTGSRAEVCGFGRPVDLELRIGDQQRTANRTAPQRRIADRWPSNRGTVVPRGVSPRSSRTSPGWR